MGMNFFDFKQFRVYQDRCAMKVGTDGVLLGAWADVAGAARILDIGCGSGVVAIIAAQRSGARVTGIDIDGPSAGQAADNARLSPFAERLHIVEADLRSFDPAERFDCILSNPPYLEEPLLPPSARQAAARHTSGLDFGTLIRHAVRLMAPEARFQVVLPQNAVRHFSEIAQTCGLSIRRQTDVVTRSGKAAKRVLLDFGNAKGDGEPCCDRLVLTDENGQPTSQYRELTRDLYLDR